MNVRTACSAAGLALHLACQSIRSNECPAALVAGSNLILSPGVTSQMFEQGSLSPDGSCKTFDAGANGYARGEAINCLYVKRLDLALQDGNSIRAVIRSSSTNADGKTPGMANPSGEAHEALMRDAYRLADIEDLSQTAMVECHGTGTPVGDPIEVGAVARCFGEKGVYIGSIKPNLGHTEGASALTSIMKSTLSLENRTILPNIKFNIPNPKIPFKEAKLTVPTETIPWPKDRLERIGINSYGIGGTNVHFILESAAMHGVAVTPVQTFNGNGPGCKEVNGNGANHEMTDPTEPVLLLFSASHVQSLKRMEENYEAYLKKHLDGISIRSLAYTLAHHREYLATRSYSVFTGERLLTENISQPVKVQQVPLSTFVLTGQGAQYERMGAELMASNVQFLRDIQEMDTILADLPHPPKWKLENEILASGKMSRLGEAEFAQPTCTALQIALVNLLARWGILPSAVIGHSSGEIAAAYAAGALTMSEAIVVAYYRGYAAAASKQRGCMAAVGLGRAQVEQQYCNKAVVVACENSASSVTISGDEDVLDTVLQAIKVDWPDKLARKLRVEKAYHSHHMAEIGRDYEQLLSKVIDSTEVRHPCVPFYSSVIPGKPDKDLSLGPHYWRQNLQSPVLFYQAAKNLIGTTSNPMLIEVGPHAALAGPLKQILKEQNCPASYVSLLSRDMKSNASFLKAMGELYCRGMAIDFPAHVSLGEVLTTPRILPNLPTYPWYHEKSYWHETRVMRNWRFRQSPHHDLLGARSLEANDTEPTWRNVLSMGDVPWLKDHCIGPDVVLPAAAYIAMAGEAARQASRAVECDYTIRDLVIKTGLVLTESRPIEMITTLRPQRLTDSTDSEWYEFLIQSSSGSSWTRHCTGLVRSGPANILPSPLENLASLMGEGSKTRKVNSKAWYKTMAKAGLNYGPCFVGMEDIIAGINDDVASATVRVKDTTSAAESAYAVHPAVLDMAFQSFTVASFRGQQRLFDKTCIPVSVDEIYIRGSETGAAGIDTSLHIQTKGSIDRLEVGRGDSVGLVDGKLAYSLKGLTGVALNKDDDQLGSNIVESHATTNIIWKPDIDFLPADKMLARRYDTRQEHALMEKLHLLEAMEVRQVLNGVPAAKDYLDTYRATLFAQLDNIRLTGHHFFTKSELDHLFSLDGEGRRSLINVTFQQCEKLGKSNATLVGSVAECIMRCADNMRQIFEGSIDPLELLLRDDLLTAIYNYPQDIWDFEKGYFFQLLGHSNPSMRILEIGAGTGGLTAQILNVLKSRFGDRFYLSYTYTDISAGFFAQAQNRFSKYTNIDYRVLDISKDPIDQGFNEGEFDLIVASNVLHATPWLTETMTNVHKLLKPRSGRLFMQEICQKTQWSSFVMGLLQGWWLGKEDGRVGVPYLQPHEWESTLRKAGFAGVDAFAYDSEPPCQVNANIIAKSAAAAAYTFKYPKAITLLSSGDKPHPMACKMKELLAAEEYELQHCLLGSSTPPDDTDIISFVDLDLPFFEDMSAKRLATVQELIANLGQATLLWLTRPSQILSQQPAFAQVIGLSRTVRREVGASWATIEMDEIDSKSALQAVGKVLRKVQRGCEVEDEQLTDVDQEYVWINGALHIGRMHWFSVPETLSDMALQANQHSRHWSVVLEIARRGLLQSLHWVMRPMRSPPAPGNIQVKIASVGMNFKDVAVAMGIVGGHPEHGNVLGLEFAGVVTAIGEEVLGMQVGDRVFGYAPPTGALANEVQLSSATCALIPDSLPFYEACTMPIVYCTVLQGLEEKARLRKGQSVLIHSAAGGIGIAAINYCRYIGAEIYATVGSTQKVEYLVENEGLLRDHIFDSHSPSFLADVMRATNGRGVDVVLNSLAGELLHVSWKCVAPNGCMVEIGKRDIAGRGRLLMDAFEENRSFFGVELSFLMRSDPHAVRLLLEKTLRLYSEGAICPIQPITRFDAAQVEEAFRVFQKGQHKGKIVVDFPDQGDGPTTLPVSSSIPTFSFKSDKAYLLVGGMKGLGASLARWMVAHGAHNLIFMSRSVGQSEDDKALLSELSHMGCLATAVAGDVTDIDMVRQVVQEASLPIAGVLQLAMVLSDASVMNMDIDQWNTAVKPKVRGTWNLHHELPEDLDFFVMTSSLSGICGYFGQANYASANTFLDAFSQFRRSQGLAASVLDLGAIDDVGFVARNAEEFSTQLSTNVNKLITEQHFLDCIQLAIVTSKPPPTIKSADKATSNGVHDDCNHEKTLGFLDGWYDPGQTCVGLASEVPIDDSGSRLIWQRDPRMAMYRNLETVNDDAAGSRGKDTGEADKTRQFIASARASPEMLDKPESSNFLAKKICRRVRWFLDHTGEDGEDDDFDLSLDLAAVGVDSLVAIEIRHWWKQTLNVEISTLELLNGGSFHDLGMLAARKLKEKFA